MDDMGMSPLEALKQSLQQAKSDGARQKILARIKAMLSSQYDSFLNQNESDLKQMEKRVQSLRTQLERRKKAKGQLLTLELQRIANEATGLVWPEEQQPEYGMGGMGGGLSSRGAMGGFGMDASYDSFDGNVRSGNVAATEDTVVDEEDETTIAMNQLGKIALATLNFESPNQHFPKNITDKDGNLLLSWRVAILKYLPDEADRELYKKFKLDEPWNSKHNIKLLNEMPDVFKNPQHDSSTETVYLGFEGKGTMFEPGNQIGFGSITDGSSNTMLVARMNNLAAIEWTKPADIPFKVGTPVTQMAEIDGNIQFTFCDGSVQKIAVNKLDTKTIETLIQKNDGNVVNIK